MVVDLKQLISDIVIDTDNKMQKQCKFCGKSLNIKDYMILSKSINKLAYDNNKYEGTGI